MKALVGAFNQEKALVEAFSVIVQPVGSVCSTSRDRVRQVTLQILPGLHDGSHRLSCGGCRSSRRVQDYHLWCKVGEYNIISQPGTNLTLQEAVHAVRGLVLTEQYSGLGVQANPTSVQGADSWRKGMDNLLEKLNENIIQFTTPNGQLVKLKCGK